MTGAVVVVNYGSSDLLRRNLDGVRSRVVVVDNHSSDAEYSAVARLCASRGWLLVASPNDGFGAGVNRGVEEASKAGASEFVLLNPDACATDNVLQGMLQHVRSNPRDVVSPTIRRPDGGVEFAGSIVDCRTGHLRRGWVDGDTDPVARNWLSGACMAFTRTVFEAVGGMASDYFLYWEDVDFSRRAVDAGFALRVLAHLEVVHAEGGTHGGGARAKSPTYYYYNTRNRLLFGSQFAREHLREWIAVTPRESLAIWLRGGRRQLLTNPAGAWAAVRGTWAGLRIARRELAHDTPREAVARKDAHRPPRVALAVLTYRRTGLLANLIPRLLAQLDEIDAHDPVLIVVDNDPDRSAQATVKSVTGRLRYVAEPQPGLSAARNRALAEASDYELLAFIDDDEVPEPGWLRALVGTYLDTRATAVVGPVRSLPQQPLSDWLEGSGMFASVDAQTGSPRRGLAAGNLLLDLSWLRQREIHFDPRFGLTGGEDSMLGQTILSRGGSIVWSAEAVVSEYVPVLRLTRAWVLARASRFGESWARGRLIDQPWGTALARRVCYAARGAVRVVRGRVLALWWKTRSNQRRCAAAEVDSAGGRGLLRGAFGANTDEYGR